MEKVEMIRIDYEKADNEGLYVLSVGLEEPKCESDIEESRHGSFGELLKSIKGKVDPINYEEYLTSKDIQYTPCQVRISDGAMKSFTYSEIASLTYIIELMLYPVDTIFHMDITTIKHAYNNNQKR